MRRRRRRWRNGSGRQVNGHPGLVVVELHPLVRPTFPFSYVKKGVEWTGS